jgi:hypothetical protein
MDIKKDFNRLNQSGVFDTGPENQGRDFVDLSPTFKNVLCRR